MSAFASLADPASRAYYDRKRAAGKRHNAALICLARRRVDVLYAMLRDRTPYTAPTVADPTPEPSGGLTPAIETPPGLHAPTDRLAVDAEKARSHGALQRPCGGLSIHPTRNAS